MITNILQDAQDIAVVAHPKSDIYIFAAKPSLNFMRQAFEQSISNPEDRDVSAFKFHWQFDEEKGITGSSTYLDLRFDKKALRPSGLWIPGLLEAKALEQQDKLEGNVYGNYGIAVFSGDNPNKQTAQHLVSQAQQLEMELPLVVQFRALDYAVGEGGIDVSFVEAPKGIITGPEAVKQIKALNYQGNSGVHRLNRDWDGVWLANWNDLANSYANGRVDWICGEATRENLTQAYESLTERKYGEKIKGLRAEQEAERTEFDEALSR